MDTSSVRNVKKKKMEYNKDKEGRENVNGYDKGYGYPVGYYTKGESPSQTPKVEGSFWVPCREKSKGRHSFCDEK